MHNSPASRQDTDIHAFCISTVEMSQVSNLNGSRLCIVGVTSPSSQAEQL